MKLNYNNILVKYERILQYAFKHADSFSLVFQVSNPYSGNIQYFHEELAQQLQPFLVSILKK